MQKKEAQKVLSSQADFAQQEALLKETVHANAMRPFFPKFHPEFNFIEMYWGACKAKQCDYSWTAVKTIMQIALISVSLSIIRKFARKSKRYIDAYREKDGIRLTTAQVEHAVRKYKFTSRNPAFYNGHSLNKTLKKFE
jgi:hypothetical protein